MKSKTKTQTQQGFALVGVIAIVAVITVVGFAGYRIMTNEDSAISQSENTATVEQQNMNEDTAQQVSGTAEYLSYQHQATLIDVTEAATLEGVAFSGNSSGTAYATFKDGAYMLYASFSNLPLLPENLFYEGWVVGGAEGIVSTGELKVVDGVFVNEFIDDVDMTDSKRYVLTLEPRDNDPAPAPGHVVDGNFTTKSN